VLRRLPPPGSSDITEVSKKRRSKKIALILSLPRDNANEGEVVPSMFRQTVGIRQAAQPARARIFPEGHQSEYTQPQRAARPTKVRHCRPAGGEMNGQPHLQAKIYNGIHRLFPPATTMPTSPLPPRPAPSP